MRVIVLGADGYLGWPTSLHLSARGHDVIAADNLIRRRWDVLCGTESLVPIASMKRRVERWKALTGREIKWEKLDLTSLADTTALVTQYQPDAIVHFAEQRSAPYSMISAQHAVETQVNNVVGTLNLLFALRESAPDCHLVKLGTMGEYGTPNIDIEEGFIDIEHNGRKDRMPYPKQPGSFYHLSKVHDSHNIMFTCRIWGIRATVRCVELAMLNAPERGEFRVFNQFTEQFSVRELAERVKAARAHHGLETKIEHLPNPRAELETHYYNAKHQHLLDLGLVPHKLEDSLIDRVIGLVEHYKKRIRPELFVPRVDWRHGGRGEFGKPAAKRRRVGVAPAIR